MDELIKALQEPEKFCAGCPHHGEPAGCNLNGCAAWEYAEQAADALEELQAQLDKVTAELTAYKQTGWEPCDYKLLGTYKDEADKARKELNEAVCEIAALRAQKEAEKNEPLAQEEVRQMVGEWVWVVVTYESGHSCQGYALIAPGKAGFLEQILPIDFYGKKWLAYRHRPKEDTENG